MQLHTLLADSPLGPRFHVISATSFGHTEPSSGIYITIFVNCFIVLYHYGACESFKSGKVYYSNQIGSVKIIEYIFTCLSDCRQGLD
jgi:hypothetical protein